MSEIEVSRAELRKWDNEYFDYMDDLIDRWLDEQDRAVEKETGI